MGRREAKRAATRDSLIAAGAEVFLERGYALASLDEIAERADLSRGAFHYNFADKRELLFAVLTANLRASIGAQPEPPQRQASLPAALGQLGKDLFRHLPAAPEHRRTFALSNELLALVLRGDAGFEPLSIPRRLDEALLASTLVRLGRSLGIDDRRNMRGVAAGILALSMAIRQARIMDERAWPDDLRSSAFAALAELPDPPPIAGPDLPGERNAIDTGNWPRLRDEFSGQVIDHPGDVLLLASPDGFSQLGDALAPYLEAELTTTVCILAAPKSPELARLFIVGLSEVLLMMRFLLPQQHWPCVRLSVTEDDGLRSLLRNADLLSFKTNGNG